MAILVHEITFRLWVEGDVVVTYMAEKKDVWSEGQKVNHENRAEYIDCKALGDETILF